MKNRHAPLTLTSLLVLSLMAPAASLAAGNAAPGGPPQFDAAFAETLGVTEDQLAACMPSPGNGAGGGQQAQNGGTPPTPPKGNAEGGQGGPGGPGGNDGMRQEMLTCLQAANPSLTTETLDEAFAAMQPGASGDAPPPPRQ